TAVAMIEVVYDNYLMSFFIRLGTTTIGITVSTLVNLLILPPNFMNEINENLKVIYKSIGKLLFDFLKEDKKQLHTKLDSIETKIKKTEELVRFQTDESQFHRSVESKQVSLLNVQKEIERLH